MTLLQERVGHGGGNQPEMAGGRQTTAADPFQRWLRQSLLTAADPPSPCRHNALHDPLPEAWLQLLDHLPPSG